MSTIDDTDPKVILCGQEPQTSYQRRLVLDRIYQLERDIATIQHDARVAARDRDALQALIVSDPHALTFQSLSQYKASPARGIKPNETLHETISPTNPLQMQVVTAGHNDCVKRFKHGQNGGKT